jgi:hypothetical protein
VQNEEEFDHVTPQTRLKVVFEKLQVTDAAPVEFMGKNDLFAKLVYGSLEYKTRTQENIGANAEWELGSAAVGSFTAAEINRIKLHFELWDENTLRSNTLIGSWDGESIEKCLETLGDVRTLKFNVVDAKKKKSGSIQVWVKVDHMVPPSAAPISTRR